MSLTGFSLFSAHCAADLTADAAAKSYEHPKETLRNFMRISGRIHGTAMSLQTKHIYEFGPFRLDAAEHLLLRDGESVQLTPKAFDLLQALVERHGRLLEKEELLKRVWPDTFVEEANLASNISLVRKALGEGENGHRYIETIPKRGYRFVASVREIVGEDEIPDQEGQSESLKAIGDQQSATANGATIARITPIESLGAWFRRHKRGAVISLAIFVVAAATVAFFTWESLRE